MRVAPAEKYGFRIRTRSGAVVDKLLIFGRDAAHAERKLRQIYQGCEILEARKPVPQRNASARYEDVVDLISGPPSLEPIA